jgi:hypothetical protein
MLGSGSDSAAAFLSQVDLLEVSPWKCPCGCASLQFETKGYPSPSGGIRPLVEYVFTSESERNGIFVYEQDGRLAGIEIYGLAGAAARLLPAIGALEASGNADFSR